MSAWLVWIGGRKFVYHLLGLAIITWLRYAGKLGEDNFLLLFSGLIFAHGTFNVLAKRMEKMRQPQETTDPGAG